MDLLGGLPPFGLQLVIATQRRQLRGAVHRHPAHDLRGHVVLGLAARLPDPLVGLRPDAFGAVRLRFDHRPQPPWQALAAAAVQQHRVQRGPEDVVLALVEGAVADPHRAGPGVAGELPAGRLGEVAAAVDPVHDLQRAVVVGFEVGDELHELLGLPVEVQVVQRLQRERAVAKPRVAVIPVALPTGGLRQRGGQRRHRGAGGHVGEPLDRQRRALQRLPPAVVGDARVLDPAPPEGDGGRHLRVGLVHVGRKRNLVAPGQRAVGLLALAQHVAGTRPLTLDAEGQVGGQRQRYAGARHLRAAGFFSQRPYLRPRWRSRRPVRS